jgi:hypothetical protein
MQVTGMTRRERRGTMVREFTYQRVLLAVYMLSDEEGLACRSCNARIGQECGHSAETVARVLAEMRRRELIEMFDNRDGVSQRMIVLKDDPKATALLDHIRRTFCRRSREPRS